MPITKVQFGNVYGVKAIQQAQTRPANNAQHQYTVDAVKDRELHPEARTEVLANRLDFLA